MFFFLNDPPTTEIYTLSLHDALPILKKPPRFGGMKTYNWEGKSVRKSGSAGMPRSEERFSRNAETDLVCRLLLEKKKIMLAKLTAPISRFPGWPTMKMLDPVNAC